MSSTQNLRHDYHQDLLERKYRELLVQMNMNMNQELIYEMI